MKKKFLTLALTGILSLASLFGGCGFSGSDSKVIDKISTFHDAEKGVTGITITYVDDLYEPEYFEIPDGVQGAIGYTGNGILNIEAIEKTVGETVQRFMLISYTDGTQMELPIIDGQNGVNGEEGKGIDHIEFKEDPSGDKILIYYAGNTTPVSINVPRGRDGDKISMSEIIEEDGAIKLTFTVTNYYGQVADTYTFTIPRGEKGDSIQSVVGSMSEDGKEYILKIQIEGQTDLTVLSFPRSNTLLTGSYNPRNDEGDVKGDGINGDMFYNTATNIFYRKTDGVWSEVLSFNQSDKKYEVYFSTEALIDNAFVTVDVTPRNRFSNLSAGTFYSNNNTQVPQASLPNNFVSDKTYQFVGWYTSSEPDFITQGAFTNLTYIASNMTLYPVFVEV